MLNRYGLGIIPPWGVDKVNAKVYNKVAMAKYDGLRKLERNRAIQEYKEAHPELSLKEIGVIFNISGSRVSRIFSNKKKLQCRRRDCQ